MEGLKRRVCVHSCIYSTCFRWSLAPSKFEEERLACALLTGASRSMPHCSTRLVDVKGPLCSLVRSIDRRSSPRTSGSGASLKIALIVIESKEFRRLFNRTDASLGRISVKVHVTALRRLILLFQLTKRRHLLSNHNIHQVPSWNEMEFSQLNHWWTSIVDLVLVECTYASFALRCLLPHTYILRLITVFTLSLTRLSFLPLSIIQCAMLDHPSLSFLPLSLSRLSLLDCV